MKSRLPFALATALVCAGCATTTSSSSGGKTASHDAFSNLPPIIDRALLFGDPQIAGAKLSPDGKYLAFLKPYKGVRNVFVKKLDAPFSDAHPVSADAHRPIPGYFWSRDGHYILFVQDQAGNENFHVWAVDPSATVDPKTGVPPARDLTPYPKTRARIVDVPKDDPAHIIVGLNDRDPSVFDLYRLDLATGERALLVKNTEGYAGFQTDLKGNVRLAVKMRDDGGTDIFSLDSEKPTKIYACDFGESCEPLRYTQDGKRFYLVTNKGHRNLTELVIFDPATGKETLVDSDPDHEVDFGGADFSKVTDALEATYYVGDRLRVYPKDPTFAETYRKIRAALPDGDLYFTSSTRDERMRLVAVTSDVDPGAVYLWDAAKGTAKLLYRPRPKLPSSSLAHMKPVTYRARDGVKIHAYLTLPEGSDGKNLPTVLFVHGGPWFRVGWGYNPFAQFLANRGYAVLMPNFRGSTGYGKKFLNLGNDQWGTGTMQDDLTDAAQWLVAQGIADPHRVAIMGGSYGGYATLAGLAFTPKVYAAGVDICGPSNLVGLLKTIPPYWATAKAMFNLRVGDPNDPTDAKRLKAQSPLFSAKKIEAPLLVVQGKNDPRVKKVEADEIVAALQGLHRPVSYLMAPDEGHGFHRPINNLAMTARIERFLAKYLHGRWQESMTEKVHTRLAALTVDPSSVKPPPPTGAIAKVTLPTFDGSQLQPSSASYQQEMEIRGHKVVLKIAQKLAASERDGHPVWVLTQSADGPMGTASSAITMDHQSLLPIEMKGNQGPVTVEIHYAADSVKGEIAMGSRKMPIDAHLDGPVLTNDDMPLALALGTMKLSPGFETVVRTFDTPSQQAKTKKVSVEKVEEVKVAGGTQSAFRVAVSPVDDPSSKTLLWIEQAAPHRLLKVTSPLPARIGGGTSTLELLGS